MKGRVRLEEVGLCMTLCTVLAVIVCFVSNNVFTRPLLRGEAVEMQFAILRGEPFLEYGVPRYMPAFQNRIFLPAGTLAVETVSSLPMAPSPY